MTQTCTVHVSHAHRHGEGCGHTVIQHGDHIGYLHDGHLHWLSVVNLAHRDSLAG